jgi:hypothetical protein
MKKNTVLFFSLLGVLFTFSCFVKFAPAKTQKVVLLYGNYMYQQGKENIIFTNGKEELKIPFSSLIDGKSIAGDAKEGLHLGALLLKDDKKTTPQILDFIKKQGDFSPISLTNGVKQPDLVNDPPCPPGQPKCPPRPGLSAIFFDMNVGASISLWSMGE